MEKKQKVSVICVLIILGIVLVIGVIIRICKPITTIDVVIPIRAQIGDIVQAVQIYAMCNGGKLPESLEELTQSQDEDDSPLLKKEYLLDPWGEPIVYVRNGRKFSVSSSGPDKIMGTADDFTN